MLDTIFKSWSWAGLKPTKVVAINLFGNLIVQAVDGSYWRICPEALECKKIAENTAHLVKLQSDNDFILDWEMKRLVVKAEQKLGTLKEGNCYCFKISPALGGEYDDSNLAQISLKEHIAFCGDLAEQIKDVPDGGQIVIKWVP